MSSSSKHRLISRREFTARLAVGSAAALLAVRPCSSHAAQGIRCPMVIFSKAYQPLKFSFDQAAEFTAEAGLDGVDSPVRPDGEIVPVRVAEELPAYVAALRKHGRQMPYLTTAITSVDSPKAEQILRVAKGLGIERYRVGFMFRSKDIAWGQQLQEVRGRLRDLAALNKQVGIGAVIQNHSPAGHTYLGGDVDELAQMVEGFDPEQMGVAFDIAHALNVHGSAWRSRFEKIRPHLKAVYIKDCNSEKRFVPLGEGNVATSGYFEVLKAINYHAPISLHIEYSGAAQPETRADLMKAIAQSLAALRKLSA